MIRERRRSPARGRQRGRPLGLGRRGRSSRRRSIRIDPALILSLWWDRHSCLSSDAVLGGGIDAQSRVEEYLRTKQTGISASPRRNVCPTIPTPILAADITLGAA